MTASACVLCCAAHNQPKIPPAVQSMLERGLLESRMTRRRSRAFFTKNGMAALRQLVLDRRAMDPARFAHLRAELGLPMESESGQGSAPGLTCPRPPLREAELCAKLGDGGLRKAAYRGGWKPA